MGAAACKNSKSTEQKSDKKENKIITIGVFGLDDAGKTSTVKAIEGKPTSDVEPTEGSATTIVPSPHKGANGETVKLIDVCGAKKYRDKLWPQYYKQIHGLIFVFDASEKKRFRENEEVLESLLEHEELKGKPILIFANKQDDRDAIKHEDAIRAKLSIEELKTKHKIELCTAVPLPKKSSADPSIREGISWLIRTIEADYSKLNARVTPAGGNGSQTPKDRRKTKPLNSDSDDVYPKKRSDSPPVRKGKLPALDSSRTKPNSRNGHDTYDENDDDPVASRQRPKISEFDSRRSRSPPLSSTSDFSKKKPAAEAPWSMPSSRSTKNDSSLLKPGGKPSWQSDISKRDTSPFSRDLKVPPLALSSKRGNLSDDDDITYGQGAKNKSPMTSTNRLKDPYDDTRFSSSARPLSAVKKSSSGIYGADDDDDGFGAKDFKKPGTASGSKFGKDPDFDDDMGKRPSRPWDRSSGVDDYRIPSAKGGALSSSGITGASRFKSGDDYYGSSATKPDSKWKSSTDDLPPFSSKPAGRPLSPLKSMPSSKFRDDDDDDRFPASNKATTRSRSPTDPYGSTWKSPSTAKHGSHSDTSSAYKPSAPFKSTDDDRPLSTNKFGSRSKLTDDYPPSSSSNLLRSRFGDADRTTSLSKPALTSKFDDDEKDSYKIPSARANASRSKLTDDLSYKSTKPPAYGDDHDRFGTSTKPGAARSTFGNKDSSSSLNKGKPFSKYGDDDDDDKFGSPSKSTTNKPKATSKYSDDEDDKFGSPSKTTNKPKTTSRFSDDDDDKYGSPSKSNNKPKATSRFSDDDDDKYGSPSKSTTKPKATSKYSDDDDDKYGSPSKSTSKPKTTSRFSDDDDDKYGSSAKTTSKPKATSKYSDDDDYKYGSSTKAGTSRSTTSNKPKASSKYSDDDDDKYGSPSKSTTKPKASSSRYSDDDDDKYGSPSKSTAKPKATSKYSDDDDDKYGSSSKTTSKPKASSRFSDDDDDKYGSPAKSTTKPKASSRYSDDDDDKYGSPSKSTSYPSKTNTTSRVGGYSGSGGAKSRYDD